MRLLVRLSLVAVMLSLPAASTAQSVTSGTGHYIVACNPVKPEAGFTPAGPDLALRKDGLGCGTSADFRAAPIVPGFVIPDTTYVALRIKEVADTITANTEKQVSEALAKKLSEKQLADLNAAVKRDAVAAARSEIEAALRSQLETFDKQLKALAARVKTLEKR